MSGDVLADANSSGGAMFLITKSIEISVSMTSSIGR